MRAKSSLATAAATVLIGCGGGSSTAACEQAAYELAAAEEAWGDEIQDHIAADDALAADPGSPQAHTDHDDPMERVLGARVTVIIAENKVRQACK